MNHSDVQKLLHAYIDGELDLARTLDVERHAEHCNTCAARLKEFSAFRKALNTPALHFQPSRRLERRIRSSVGGWHLSGFRAIRPAHVLALVGVCALIAIVLWKVPALVGPERPDDITSDELLQSHLRSLMLTHLTDVPSTDQHQVKPWFDGKLDFSPMVKDLSAEGYVLAGGRLDYVTNRPVAVVVYRRRLHVINLFTWPSSTPSDAPISVATRRGYYFVSWSRGGMMYSAVSDVNPEELKQFARLLEG